MATISTIRKALHIARRPGTLARATMALLLLTSWSAASAHGEEQPYHGRPLAFEANRGQADEQVKFLARGAGYTAFLTPTEAVLTLGEGRPGRAVIRVRPAGANAAARILPDAELPGVVNYFRGVPATASVSAPTYAKVRYVDVYPGIDLVYYGDSRQLEYDFVVAPGADPHKIALTFDGVDRMELDSSGALVLHTAAGELRQPRPVVYQDIDGAQRLVVGDYVVDSDGRVRVRLGAYDTSRPLVIDPILASSTYLGGSGDESHWLYGPVFGIAVDKTGNVYVTGTTSSTDFPTTAGADRTFGGDTDVFVTKFSPTGTVLYSTYLGGPCEDVANAIAVDAAGNAYITGRVHGGACFADVTAGVLVAKLGPTGAVLYASVFGGRLVDTSIGQGIAVDASGHAYVTGTTSSADFPTTPGALRTEKCADVWASGSSDGFVAKLSPDGSAFVYSTFLCGSGDDSPSDIAIDAAGNAYVAGTTGSGDFPTVNPLQASLLTFLGVTGFVSKLSPDGSSLIYSTFLGGSINDAILGIAVDGAGNVYVTGETQSEDFPTTPRALQEHSGFRLCVDHLCTDAFVTKIDPSGSAIVYSTYLFGEGDDTGSRIAVDDAGNAYVVGTTSSRFFPIVDAFQPSNHGLTDAFVAKLSPDGTRLVYSSFLGGSRSGPSPSTGTDEGSAIAVDAAGNAYVAGYTQSYDFPTTPGAFQRSIGGGVCDFFGGPCGDAFVAKISADGPGVPPPMSVTPAVITPGGTVTATWAGLPEPATNDELRLYTLGSTDGPLGDQVASWLTGGAAGGTLALALPADLPTGTYEVRVISRDPNFFDLYGVMARTEPLTVAWPDLKEKRVSNSGGPFRPGDSFTVSDMVVNNSPIQSGSSKTRYYLSLDGSKDPGDKRLVGGRPIPNLPPFGRSVGSAVVTIPLSVAPGTYAVFACADDKKILTEAREGNNCRASDTPIVVVP